MELVKRDYKVDDILLREVNGELVRNFDLYLKTEKHCAQNTVIRYMKCFKKVINLAIANEWITKNPFVGIKFHEVEVNKQFLSQAEINKIWQKEFKIERLELVRDVFIFCVYTGLAFIDVYNLRPEHISEDSNGNLWIVKAREKTNNLCNIPLLSIPKQILDKYKDVEFEGHKALPVISRRLYLAVGLQYLILSIALGKLAGSLAYFFCGMAAE